MRRLLLILASLIAALPEFVSSCALRPNCTVDNRIVAEGDNVVIVCSLPSSLCSWHGNGSLLQNGSTSEAAKRKSLTRQNIDGRIKFLIEGSQKDDEGLFLFCDDNNEWCSTPVTVTVTNKKFLVVLETKTFVSFDATNVTIPASLTTGSRNHLCFQAYFTWRFHNYYVFCVRNKGNVKLVLPLKSDQLSYQLKIRFLNLSSVSWTWQVTVLREVDNITRPTTLSTTTSTTVTSIPTRGLMNTTGSVLEPESETFGDTMSTTGVQKINTTLHEENATLITTRSDMTTATTSTNLMLLAMCGAIGSAVIIIVSGIVFCVYKLRSKHKKISSSSEAAITNRQLDGKFMELIDTMKDKSTPSSLSLSSSSSSPSTT